MTVRFLFLFYLIGAWSSNLFAQRTLDAYFQENKLSPESAYGLYYQVDKLGKGEKPKKGDYILLDFKASLLDGIVYEESDPNDPFVFQVGYNQVIRGWDLGMTLFPMGSKGTIYIPSQLGYGKRGAGTTIPPNSALIIEVNPQKILNQKEYDAYMIELEKKEQAAYQAKIQKQFTIDRKLIQDYSLSNKLRTKRTKSGLSYAITKKGKGTLAAAGDELIVKYEGFLLDGSPFDQTKEEDTFSFTLGKRKVIAGWDEGLQYFNEGSEGWLLIPSKLGYGPRSIYEKGVSVPSNSVLIFKIKVLKINSKKL